MSYGYIQSRLAASGKVNDRAIAELKKLENEAARLAKDLGDAVEMLNQAEAALVFRRPAPPPFCKHQPDPVVERIKSFRARIAATASNPKADPAAAESASTPDVAGSGPARC